MQNSHRMPNIYEASPNCSHSTRKNNKSNKRQSNNVEYSVQNKPKTKGKKQHKKDSNNLKTLSKE